MTHSPSWVLDDVKRALGDHSSNPNTLAALAGAYGQLMVAQELRNLADVVQGLPAEIARLAEESDQRAKQ